MLNVKNKIFIFNLKLKLEGRLKAVIFFKLKKNTTCDHVTAYRSRNPSLLSILLHPSILSSHGLPWAGRGRGRGKTGSSVSRPHGPLAPPPSQVYVALKQPRQAGDSDQKHNRGYQARTPGSWFPWYQIKMINTITVTVTCGFR